MDPLKILIVDDNEHDALLMSRALRHDGMEHEAKRIDTPEELERALRFETWDAILTDHAMPRMDSFHVLRRAQELAPTVPVIVVSGFIGEEAAAHVVREGARDFVSKERLAFLVPTLSRAFADERRRRELEQARAMLARNERLAVLGTFARGAAHEINNPLTYVHMEAEMTLDAARGRLERASDEERRFLTAIIESQQAVLRGSDRIRQIVHGIGMLSASARRVSPASDVDDVVAAAVPLAPGRVHLEKEFRAAVACQWPVEAVKHIVATLVENAYDAVAVKGEGTVRITTLAQGPTAVIEVADDGPGIPPQEQPLLFTPFHTTKPAGIGLNLAISHRLAEDLGGTLTFQTSPAGTTWRLTLPLTPPARGPLAISAGAVVARLP